MTRVTPGFQILIAAVIAFIFGLIASFTLGQAELSLIVSFVGLATFLGGVLSPWIAGMLINRKPKVRTKKAATAKPAQNPDGSDAVTLYVGNLPFKTSEDSVQDAFQRYGEVFAVRLVKDRRTGKRKGYGFVEMESVGADLALAKLNDSDFEGRTLKVRAANSDRKD